MKTYTNKDGYSVYELESFSDFIAIDGEILDKLLEDFPMMIYMYRALYAAAIQQCIEDGNENPEQTALGLLQLESLVYVDDGKRFVGMMDSDGNNLFSATITKQ